MIISIYVGKKVEKFTSAHDKNSQNVEIEGNFLSLGKLYLENT